MTDFASSALVEKKLGEWKSEFIKKAKGVEFEGRNEELFRQAVQIQRQYKSSRDRNEYHSAFYCLHLYLNLVLDKSLLRLGDVNPRFAEHSNKLRKAVRDVDIQLGECMQGMREMILKMVMDEKREIEAKEYERKKAKSATPIIPPAAAAAISAGAGVVAGQVMLDGSNIKVRGAEEARNALDALRISGGSGGKLDVDDMYAKVGGPSNSNSSSNAIDQPNPSAPPMQHNNDDAPPPPYAPPSSSTGGAVGNRMPLNSSHAKTEDINVSRMTVKRVTGDGHCAFRSIAQGLKRGRLDSSKELEEALKLRRTTVKSLIRRKDDEMTGTGLTVSQMILMKDEQYTSFNSYATAMNKSAHAGETEFWLLADEIRNPIAIFTQHQDGGGQLEHLITYGENSNHTNPPVCLLWQRGAFSEHGNHYDLLIETTS